MSGIPFGGYTPETRTWDVDGFTVTASRYPSGTVSIHVLAPFNDRRGLAVHGSRTVRGGETADAVATDMVAYFEGMRS